MTDLKVVESRAETASCPSLWGERALIKIIRVVPGMHRVGPSDTFRLALQGSFWTFFGYGAGQLLRLVSTLVLARMLLSPKVFGLVALVNVFLGGLEMLSDLGIGVDVVQHRRGDEPAFINTAFAIQVVRGLVLWGIATALAYPFAAFYHQPDITALAKVAAISVGIRSFSSGSLWLMTRHVKLRTLTTLNIIGDVAGLIVSLVWAWLSPTAWALVLGRLVSSLTVTVGSYLVGEHRTSVCWDPAAARDILTFGSAMFLSTATYFLSAEAERLVIGKFITLSTLGCFSLALTIASAPSRALQQVAGQVFFPMISRSLRQDSATAARHFLSARYAFTVLSGALGIAFIAYSHRLVTLLLPKEYEMTAWMLQFLGFRAAFDIFASLTSNLVLACGIPRYSAVANALRLFLMFCGVWFAFARFGLVQAIAVLAFAPVLSYLVLIPALFRHAKAVALVDVRCLAAFLGSMAIAAMLHWPWA